MQPDAPLPTVPCALLQYWKSLRNHPPIYGADQSNSMFDKGVHWNLSEIKTILK